jgi:hypothetical protein
MSQTLSTFEMLDVLFEVLKASPVTSVADPGYLSRIPDPNCLHPGSRICIKEFKYS